MIEVVPSRSVCHGHSTEPPTPHRHMSRNSKPESTRRVRWTYRTAVILLMTLASTAHAQVIFVDTSAPPGGDGTSWSKAFTYLQDGIDRAHANGETQIWVAAGTYYPDESSNGDSDDREASFTVGEGLSVYGGFVGGETHISERPVRMHESAPTILGGDIDQSGHERAREDSVASYHIVRITGTALIDGFIVTGGNDDRPTTLSNADGVGGGLVVDGGSPTGVITPTIRNCVFANNSSTAMGASIAFVNAGGLVVNTFVTNSGGGDHFTRIVSATAARTNVEAPPDMLFPVTMKNVTIAGNGGQAFFDLEGSLDPRRSSKIVFTAENSIIVRNALDLPEGSPTIFDSDATLRNVIFDQQRRYCNGRDLTCENVSGAAAEIVIDGFGYVLGPASPARDFGDVAFLPPDTDDLDGDGDTNEAIPVDASNGPRIHGRTVDAGAFEATIADVAAPDEAGRQSPTGGER